MARLLIEYRQFVMSLYPERANYLTKNKKISLRHLVLQTTVSAVAVTWY